MSFSLVTPSLHYLPSYIAALRKGWLPNNMRQQSAIEELERIERDAQGYIDWLDSRNAQGEVIPLPDGTFVPRLPGFRQWMWDGEFCGSIALRWQAGSNELPDFCLGHVGYSVVPWKQRLGYATQALKLLLPMAREQDLAYLVISTQPENTASQKVILNNGGQFLDAIKPPVFYGHGEEWRYRLELMR
ncbi:GNAT family N-acetyltransferase [Variovorax sp. PCZ-1]|uniref:GNAT family N-acetyltransferase n=1 Tax=Variovorax sp. PCZ-1 TaxID=2835533 RepID=UPI001BCF6463|nr:GNAT family N-acetyltransferase [Variovorax sp. PCZ-1]MBS7808094.1 GNAT family N-acetyltransferase [Variovorax sp. PCZ-1]